MDGLGSALGDGIQRIGAVVAGVRAVADDLHLLCCINGCVYGGSLIEVAHIDHAVQKVAG